MANTTIMLAKNIEDVKWEFPVLISEKYDGVACSFEKLDNTVIAYTRQGVMPLSVGHLIKRFNALLDNRQIVIGEVWMPHTPFKEISGMFRKSEPAPQLGFKAYDLLGNLYDRRTFYLRNIDMCNVIPEELKAQQYLVRNQEELKTAAEYIKAHSQAYEFEGYMIRPISGDESRFKLGRSNGMLRWVEKPTVDLKVEGLVEAKTKEGVPKGEVGAFIVTYNGQQTKVGAGKSAKAQRTDWWNNPDSIIGKTIQIQYKFDASYDGLRQPTFQRTREDKD